jgi:hypothetical protein
LSTAEHAAIDAAVLRTAVAAPPSARSHALARPCATAARALVVGGWLVAAAASLPPLGGAGLVASFCVTVALFAIAATAAGTRHLARSSAALAACAAALCLVVAPGPDTRLVLAGLALALAGSALAVPAAHLARATYG